MPVSREPRPSVRRARRAERRLHHERDRGYRVHHRPARDRYGHLIPYAPLVR